MIVDEEMHLREFLALRIIEEIYIDKNYTLGQLQKDLTKVVNAWNKKFEEIEDKIHEIQELF